MYIFYSYDAHQPASKHASQLFKLCKLTRACSSSFSAFAAALKYSH